MSLYTYDAGGERVAKLSGSGESVYVNSKNAGKRTQTNRYTAYISPYFVLSSGGEYTKHIMIGSQRIVSKLGDVGSFGQDPRRIEYAGTTESIKVDYKTKYKKSQQIFKDRYKRLNVVYNGVDNDDYRGGDSFCCGKQKDGFGKKGARLSKSARGGITNNDKPELHQYYYHPDHLGSSSYITNLDGEVAQHIEYVPFGEVFINEQNNRWNTPYLFNGKELDEETGLYYYGTRYFSPRDNIWLVVDPPMLDGRYLDGELNSGIYNPNNLAVYSYTWNNPVKYKDPEGECPNCLTAAIGGVVGGLVGGGIEAGMQLWKSGKITDWSAVGGATVQGAITGTVAGFTGGASLVVTAGTTGAANIVGGAVNRAVQGKETTATDIVLDGAIGAASGVTGGLVKKGLDKLSNTAKGKLGEAITKIKYGAKGYISKNKAHVKTGGKTPTGRDAKAIYDHKMKNLITGKQLTVESKFNTSGLTNNQRAAAGNVTTPGGLILDRTTSQQLGSVVGGAAAGIGAQKN